jgi:hypothetical protein
VLALALALLLAQAPTVPPVAPTPAASPTPAPGPVSATATATKSEVTVGEEFRLTVIATGPAGTSYTFPGEAAGESLELRPVLAEGQATATPGTQQYEAAVFALGELQIPAIPVRYRLPDGTSGETTTQPIPLRVLSLLPKDPEQQKLADVRPPVPVSVGGAFWVALALVLLALVLFAGWLWRRRRRAAEPAAQAAEPALAPDAQALRDIDALARLDLVGRGEYRRFYIALTEIAKRYLERRFGAPVLEMTTAETLAFLRGHPVCDDMLPLVRDVSEAADRIKFARAEGLAAEAERHLASVRRMVPVLEERLAPRPPLPEEGKAA